MRRGSPEWQAWLLFLFLSSAVPFWSLSHADLSNYCFHTVWSKNIFVGGTEESLIPFFHALLHEKNACLFNHPAFKHAGACFGFVPPFRWFLAETQRDEVYYQRPGQRPLREQLRLLLPRCLVVPQLPHIQPERPVPARAAHFLRRWHWVVLLDRLAVLPQVFRDEDSAYPRSGKQISFSFVLASWHPHLILFVDLNIPFWPSWLAPRWSYFCSPSSITQQLVPCWLPLSISDPFFTEIMPPSSFSLAFSS